MAILSDAVSWLNRLPIPPAQLAAWILLGLIAGALARWVLPGEEKAGWFLTMVLGIVGALIGGWIARHFGWIPPAGPGDWFPSPKSIGFATGGAVVLLAAWKWLKR